MSKQFAGKTAIVTGAASGIGEAVAMELAAGGATVIVSDLSDDKALEVCAAIGKAGGTAFPFVADVSDAEACEALVAFAVKKGGALHLAVNNAGIGGPSEKVGDYPLDGWRKVIDVNLNGVFYGMRYQIPAMMEAGGGAIVNMASILGSVGFMNARPMSPPSMALSA
jgi:NAD(P)-dependent dehydrogenase (short-subunit alcohol dehydrogenase family)